MNPWHQRLQVYGVLAATGTALPLLGRWFHWFDVLANFRVQFAVGLVLLTLVLCALRSTKAAVVTLVTASLNASTFLSSYVAPVAVRARPSPRDLKVMTYNLYVNNPDLDAARALITEESPDVLLLLELTPRAERLLALHELGYESSIAKASDGAFGIGVYSRLPVVNAQIVNLGEGAQPAVIADFELPEASGFLHVVGLHPYPPVSDDATRFRDSVLRAAAAHVARRQGPTILLGDFNATPWTDPFRALVAYSGLCDTRLGFGVQASWPRWNPLLGVPIDHILVSRDFTVLDRQVVAGGGSDHDAVTALLALPMRDARLSSRDEPRIPREPNDP